MVILNIKTNKHSSINHTDILENIFLKKWLLIYIGTIRTKKTNFWNKRQMKQTFSGLGMCITTWTKFKKFVQTFDTICLADLNKQNTLKYQTNDKTFQVFY